MRAMLVALLLLTVTLAGCSSTSMPPDQRHGDADFRFAGRATEAFEQHETLSLQEGAHTIRISVESEDGFGLTFQGPPWREPYSGMMMPSAQHGFSLFERVSITDLRYTTWDTQGGDWELAFGCNGPCVYTVAIDNNDTVPEIPRFNPMPKMASASGSLTDDHDEIQFEVPRIDNTTMVAMDFYSREAITFKIFDPDGDQAGWWNMNHAYARGWMYESRSDSLDAGTWTLEIGCDGTCDFDIGLR